MQKVQKGVTSALLWIFLIGTSLFVLYPLIYVVSAAFSPEQNICSGENAALTT